MASENEQQPNSDLDDGLPEGWVDDLDAEFEQERRDREVRRRKKNASRRMKTSPMSEVTTSAKKRRRRSHAPSSSDRSSPKHFERPKRSADDTDGPQLLAVVAEQHLTPPSDSDLVRFRELSRRKQLSRDELKELRGLCRVFSLLLDDEMILRSIRSRRDHARHGAP